MRACVWRGRWFPTHLIAVSSDEFDNCSRRVKLDEVQPAAHGVPERVCGVGAVVVHDHTQSVRVQKEGKQRVVGLVSSQVHQQQVDVVLRPPAGELSDGSFARFRCVWTRDGCRCPVDHGVDKRCLSAQRVAQENELLSLQVFRPKNLQFLQGSVDESTMSQRDRE